MNVIQCCIMFCWTYLMFLSFLFTQMISDRTTWRRYVQFTYWWELVVHWAGHFLLLGFSLCHSNNCIFFSRQPFLIFVGSWSMNWCSLEMQIQVPLWWSLSSSTMAKSCSSLFASCLDGRGRNLIGTCMKASSPMTYGRHLASVVVHGLMRQGR